MDGLEHQSLTAVHRRHCSQFPISSMIPEMFWTLSCRIVALISADRSIYISKNHLGDRAAITHISQCHSKSLVTIRLFDIPGRPNDRYTAWDRNT